MAKTISIAEADTLNANAVKEIVLNRLVTEKIITKKQGEDFTYKWQVIIVKPSWFKRWASKLKITDDEGIYKIVKFED
jgi:hypothetical protein